MTHLSWPAVIVASAVAACASSNQASSARRAPAELLPASPFDTTSPNMKAARMLAGCYSLAVGTWSDERAPGWHVTIPSRIQLDTVRNDSRRPGFELVARTPTTGMDGRGMERPPAWSPVGTDSLQVVVWHNGTSDINLFLRRRAAGRLQGTARYFWDQIRLDPVTKRWLWEQYPTAPATLTAISCGS